jgi:hypothetical protein
MSVLAAAGSGALAQEPGAGQNPAPVTREQYEKLLQEHQKLLEEMKEMKAFRDRMEESLKKPAAQQAEVDAALDDIDKQIKSVKAMAKDSYPGSSKMLLTGYGTAGFISQDQGGDRKFYAAFNPIFLWKISDRIFFEGELEAELEGSDTSLALEMAHLSYVANDYLTVSGGKFLNPVNYFVERQHMNWVNKLPDKPLAVYDGLLPESNVGAQLRGGVPLGLGSSKIGYALYAANAPELQNDPASVAASDFGTFTWDNFDNIGRHFAYGGRLGILPIPEFELGYGLQYSDVTPPGSSRNVNSFLHSADASYVRESELLKGWLNLKAQYVWSRVGSFQYDPGSVNGGPYNFENNREGGYFQIAYRPTRMDLGMIKNLEPVFRYDLLNQKQTPTGVDESRYTVGLNYWFGPSTVVKVAYEWDHQTGPNSDPHNAIMAQFVTGF